MGNPDFRELSLVCQILDDLEIWHENVAQGIVRILGSIQRDTPYATGIWTLGEILLRMMTIN